MIASDGVPLLEVAIPQQQANRDQEREASVEGDDVELPEPVIELIDDDLPGTQPCSRRAAEPKKRTRSRSPSRAREASVQRQVPTTRPPLDQRIQLELGLHTAGESSKEYQSLADRGLPEIPPPPPPPGVDRGKSRPAAKRPATGRDAPTHVPVVATSASAATRRPSQAPHRETIRTDRVYPNTSINLSTVRTSTPSLTADPPPRHLRGNETAERQPSPTHREGLISRGLSLQPTHGRAQHGRSASPRGRRLSPPARHPGNRDPSFGHRDARHGDRRW